MNIGRFAPFRVRFVPWSIHDNQLTLQFPSRVLGIPTVQTIQQIGANDKVKVRFGVLVIVNGQQVWGGQRLIAFNFFVVHFDGERRRKCRFDGQVSQQKTVPGARGHGGFVGARATRHNPYFVRGTSVYDVCCHQKMPIGRRIERTTKDGDALATWGWWGVVMLVPEVEPCNAGGRTEGDRQVGVLCELSVVHFWIPGIRVFSVRGAVVGGYLACKEIAISLLSVVGGGGCRRLSC